MAHSMARLETRSNAHPFAVPASYRPKRMLTAALVLGSTLVLAGCMSGGNRVQPLTPVPTTAVSSSSLPQPIALPQDTSVQSQTLADANGLDPANQALLGDVDTALGAPGTGLQNVTLAPDGAVEVGEDDLVGVWSAATPAATCSINLSLTNWQGGLRASTRNCADAQMAGLSAWSIEGQQVLLRGPDGAPLARLFRTGPTRYAGQLETGEAVTVFR